MTTPDTLASLPKRWRRTAALVDAQKQDRAYPSGEPYEDCARELEAALDALVEKWESAAKLLRQGQHEDAQYLAFAVKLEMCAAELRGRGVK